MAADGVQTRARDVLLTADPEAKAAAACALRRDWLSGSLAPEAAPPQMPDRPGPARPELLAPREMPKRRKAGALQNRIALLHAVAHIELNAIDLAIDIAGRFGTDGGAGFIDDWLKVADDEAQHFMLLQARLKDMGASYGDLPAHDGLWEAAETTRNDVCARLAVAHMVLEARGLDVTPAMIERFQRNGDGASAAVLKRIYTDEIGHVETGSRWFSHFAAQRNRERDDYWRELVSTHFRGKLKRPFNHEAREMAEMPPALYEPLAD